MIQRSGQQNKKMCVQIERFSPAGEGFFPDRAVMHIFLDSADCFHDSASRFRFVHGVNMDAVGSMAF